MVPAPSKWSRKYWQDLVERVVATFIQALIPCWVAASSLNGFDWENALYISLSAAGLSLLKGLLANLTTGTEVAPTASVVPVSSNRN